jgi:hypothetical protein
MLVAEKMLVQGFHYPVPSFGHVEKACGGYRRSGPLEPDDLNNGD